MSILLLAILTTGSCIKERVSGGDVKVGDIVPAFSAEGMDGNSFNSASFTGKRSLLVLFVTTCSDCQRELPLIEWIWGEVKDNPQVQVLAISREEERSVVHTYWELEDIGKGKTKFTIPVYLDPNREIFSKFATSTVPRIYIVNDRSVVEWMAIEDLDISKEELLGKLL